MPKPEVQILVCTNERPADHPKPCCSGRDSVELYRRLKDGVRERGLKDRVLVTRTGCLKHCSRGITVAVWPHSHWYGGAAPADADELLEAAVGGRELERLKMPEDAPWE